MALLAAAEQHLAAFGAAAETPLPSVGMVGFYVKTFDGLLQAVAREQECGEGGHVLSPVFFAAHDVIAAVRKSSPGQ